MFSLQKLLLERVGKTSWEKSEAGNRLFASLASAASGTRLLGEQRWGRKGLRSRSTPVAAPAARGAR